MVVPARYSKKYEARINELYTLATSGQRIYFPELSYINVEGVQHPVAILFKMKNRLPGDIIEDCLLAEYPNRDSRPKGVGPELYLNRLSDLVKERTWQNLNQKFSERVTFSWPASTLEEWMEEKHDCHWMTMQWFRNESNSGFSFDYASLTTVYVPIRESIEEYNDEYGSAFVMTKLMHDA